MKNKIYYSALILLNIVIIFSVYIVIENNQNKKIINYTDSINTKINNAQNSINSALSESNKSLISATESISKSNITIKQLNEEKSMAEKKIYDTQSELDETKSKLVDEENKLLKANYELNIKKENLKQDIINYNKDDCISTYKLTEFLRNEKEKKYSDIPWFSLSADDQKKHQEEKEWEKKDKELIKNLEKKKNESNNDFINNLQSIVGFYRRERKPEFWAMYDRKDKEHEDLVDNTTCIANCFRTSDPPEEYKQSQLFKYKFQKQDYKLREGETGYDILGTTSRTSNDKKDTGFNIKKITEKEVKNI